MDFENPTDEQIEEVVKRMVDDIERDVVPQMRRAAFCMMVFSGTPGLRFAMELGVALLLDKPLIIVIIGDAHVPKGILHIAEEVIRGKGLDDPTLRDATQAAIQRCCARMDSL